MDDETTGSEESGQPDEVGGGGGSALRGVGGLIGLGGLLAWLLRRRCRCCDGGRVRWPGTPAWSPSGSMTNVGDVNSFIAAERPCWRYYPESAGQVVLGMDVSGQEPTPAFTLEYHPSAGSGETDVIVTRDVVGDDAVAAERFVLTFGDEAIIGGDVGGHRLLSASRSFRCHPGRGHEDWGTTPCT